MMIGRRNGGTSRDESIGGTRVVRATRGAVAPLPERLERAPARRTVRVRDAVHVALDAREEIVARRLRHGDRAAGSGDVRGAGATSDGALTISTMRSVRAN